MLSPWRMEEKHFSPNRGFLFLSCTHAVLPLQITVSSFPNVLNESFFSATVFDLHRHFYCFKCLNIEIIIKTLKDVCVLCDARQAGGRLFSVSAECPVK